MFEDLSLHILDIVENSIRAKAKNIEIKIKEDKKKDLLLLEIIDDGEGMNKEMARKALDPFITTKSGRRVGLGLPFLAQATRMANGDFSISSKEGQGTRIKASFQYSHIDRQPVGNIKETLMALVAGNPEVDFIFVYKKNRATCFLDTKELKAENIFHRYDYAMLMNYLNRIFKKLNQEVKNE